MRLHVVQFVVSIIALLRNLADFRRKDFRFKVIVNPNMKFCSEPI